MKIRTVAISALLVLFSAASSMAAGPYPYEKEQTVIGSLGTYTVKKGESLIEIARHFDLGYNEIVDANPGLDPFVPGSGADVVIPRIWVLPDVDSYNGIVVNISEMRLYYFFEQGKSKVVQTFPIGIGDQGKDTPVGTFRVIQKIVNPVWHVPASIQKERPELPRQIPPGPENPLGSYALRLSLGDVLIHGTNRPFAVGRRVTHGCIRLYPEDIPRLYGMVPNGMKVTIVRQPVKVGVNNKRVYIEVHKYENEGEFNYFNEAVKELTKAGLLKDVSTEKIYQAIEDKSGIPVDISP
ncbi:MAG: L,D-transpeptidase family protein [Nitrospirae bacterium]|nr:L,D-transpeptidase family protein [Nitrospirota bacterium]